MAESVLTNTNANFQAFQQATTYAQQRAQAAENARASIAALIPDAQAAANAKADALIAAGAKADALAAAGAKANAVAAAALLPDLRAARLAATAAAGLIPHSGGDHTTIPAGAGVYRIMTDAEAGQVWERVAGGGVLRRPELEAAAATDVQEARTLAQEADSKAESASATVGGLTITTAALQAGTLNAGANTRLLDAFGPLTVLPDAQAPAANGGTVFQLAGGRRAVRPDWQVMNVTQFPGATDTERFNAAIAAANAVVGGRVIIKVPIGTYDLPTGTNPITREYVYIVGEERYQTVIRAQGGSLFTWQNDGGGASRFTVAYNGTYGADPIVFNLNGANRTQFYDLELGRVVRGWVCGSATSPSSAVKISNLAAISDNGGQPLIDLVNGAGLFMDNFNAFVHGVNPPAPGQVMTTVQGTDFIRLNSKTWDTVQINYGLVERYGSLINVGLGTNAGAPYHALNWQVSDVICDYLRFDALKFAPNGGYLAGWQFTNCYFTSWEGVGIRFGGTSGGGNEFTFNNCRIFQCGDNGVLVSNTGFKGIEISGSKIYGTNRNGNGAPAVAFYPGVRRFSIVNNDINYDASGDGITWTSPYGLAIDPDCDEYIATGNRVYGSALPFLLEPNTSASKKRLISGNPLENYSGIKTGAQYALPASGVTYVNKTALRLMVSVGGGTVTGISVEGAALGLTSGVFELAPGEGVAVTYSAAPTWTVRALR